ncbi:MAG: ribonuclease HI family protein [Patescibacteria group bacterium]
MKLSLFCDGGARGNPGPAAAAAVIFDSTKNKIAEVAEFLGDMTNNRAEYFGVVLGLQKALEFHPTEIEIFLDSKLAVEQISGRWKIKDLELKKLAEKVHALLVRVPKWKIAHVAREKNRDADRLVNQVLDSRGFKKAPKLGFFRS